MARSAVTTADGQVFIVLLVDPDDPDLAQYEAINEPGVRVVVLAERVRFTGSLNIAAREAWDNATILGAFGDDVIFRTPGWDRIVEETLATPGIAYGDDLIHGQNHPSAIFMSSEIAKALGWLALPAVWHTWADDAWKRLGQETGLLRYMPEVIVEHMHPAVGKAEDDETYRSAYSTETGQHDYPAFAAWVESGMAEDVAKVRAALG